MRLPSARILTVLCSEFLKVPSNVGVVKIAAGYRRGKHLRPFGRQPSGWANITGVSASPPVEDRYVGAYAARLGRFVRWPAWGFG